MLSSKNRIEQWKLLDEDDLSTVHQFCHLDEHKSKAALEAEFKEFIRCEYAVHTASGRSALLLSLKALEIEKSEVLVPDFACEVVPSCVLKADCIPVFTDVDEATFNMSSEAACNQITGKTKAIILVHTFGQPADLKSFIKIGDEFGIDVISDAAQALGAEYMGKKLGSFEKIAVFSLNKNLACMKGGFVTTNDREIARKVRVLRDSVENSNFVNREKKILGVLSKPFIPQKISCSLIDEMRQFVYNSSFLGKKNFSEPDNSIEYLNSKQDWRTPLDGLDVSLTRSQLTKIEALNAKRIENAEILREIIKKYELDVAFPEQNKDAKHVYTRFPVRVKALKNYFEFMKLKQKLLIDGVLVDMTYKSLHSLPSFNKLSSVEMKIKYVSEALSFQVLPLPLNPSASYHELEILASKLKKRLSNLEKSC
jgi:dTDP-4-amino-4,6-dideoxygalactose transaminase